MRSEQEIFDELAELCSGAGYAHAVAYLCYESNIVRYSDELQGEDYAKLFDKDRLIRTELSTLIGLMVRKPLVLTIPSSDELAFQIQRSKALLEELHDAMKAPWLDWIKATAKSEESGFFDSGEAMREAIFYGAESAYPFQYRDLAPHKYALDNDWLAGNKGFSCDNAKEILTAIRDCLSDRFGQKILEMKSLSPEHWTVLPGFGSPSMSFVDGEGKRIAIPQNIASIHPICIVSEHYPALSYQTHSLLKFELTSGVVTPFVCDVFLLDTLTEMLESPLRCLSFLELRAKVGMNLLIALMENRRLACTICRPD